ncbi:MAG: hypothetical protein WCC18_13775, partial [Candidatus Acidiferrales bacterium]
VQQPSTWCGRSEQILLNQVGCEARKIPADAEVFFLDFPFYRTNRAVWAYAIRQAPLHQVTPQPPR